MAAQQLGEVLALLAGGVAPCPQHGFAGPADLFDVDGGLVDGGSLAGELERLCQVPADVGAVQQRVRFAGLFVPGRCVPPHALARRKGHPAIGAGPGLGVGVHQRVPAGRGEHQQGCGVAVDEARNGADAVEAHQCRHGDVVGHEHGVEVRRRRDEGDAGSRLQNVVGGVLGEAAGR